MTVLSWAFWWLGFGLATSEVWAILRGPTRLHCACPNDFTGGPHLRSWALYAVGGSYALSILAHAGVGGGWILLSVMSIYYFWRAWKHSKDGRKKLKDKVLGVVRETEAGLKVVPESGAAA